MSGSPFQTPEPLAGQSRAKIGRDGDEDGRKVTIPLSRLLAKRERGKGVWPGGTGSTMGQVLRNSREYHSSRSLRIDTGCQKAVSKSDGVRAVKRGKEEDEGMRAVTRGKGEGEGVRDVLAVWNHLLESMKKACLNGQDSQFHFCLKIRFYTHTHTHTHTADIKHIGCFELLDQRLLDFDPSHTHFTMRRK